MKNEEFDLLKKIPMNVYDNQHPVLKNYIRPYYAKCLDEIGTWLRNPGDPRHMLGFKQDDPVIFTEDGVRVWSKTEKFYGDSFPLKTNLLKAAFGQLFFACDGKMQSCPPKLVEFLRLSPPKLVEILQSTAMLHR